MANDQATYALVAYWRFENKMRALYDMRGDWSAETKAAITDAVSAIDALPLPTDAIISLRQRAHSQIPCGSRKRTQIRK